MYIEYNNNIRILSNSHSKETYCLQNNCPLPSSDTVQDLDNIKQNT